ncbi:MULTISPECIES: metallophosphoesterase family protein [unclassified Herbaspirillum]|uniref:metallophosphoesterase family protein n=1 Tax=unclassified Herbaspirillum TaxID=2624150 RepID=UPI000E2F5295|nr:MULTISPECIES: metallophosphoesterase family protein [unclassified Herbaspirillum]RFB73269.1 metallophosphoesterase [Herbaspirillum sp. 3R-3a1]TFI10922.1 metallophosphoesterase [Herbaspirillum sp. 3R11]TFI16830.1 metallophosphoesterase [Herbaspirillum sp. 3R-11]TFI26413.1 metallophosphoesterase [Herbaspirillum sp. 3C11]TFI26418.1 metallophosphoesterase [Herbaspirillum sp. 3C11]
MRTIVHLSDLHFGRIDEALIAPIIAQIHELAPDLIVVSGDLTQRARSEQFREARQFLDALPQPQIVVPGNHDIPLFNVAARFFSPLTKYRRHITEQLQPIFIDEEIAVIGINTARSLTIKDGRVNDRQIEIARRELAAVDDQVVKIIVTHHPFDLPPGPQHHDLVGKALPAMRAFAICGADVLLAGHVHTSSAASSAARYDIQGYSALVVQAGTATSTRSRGETNSFNVLRVEAHHIVVERMHWQVEQGKFVLGATDAFEQRGNEWFAAP